MSKTPDTLAARLKLARELSGLTQAALAKRAGMKQPDISKLELGTMLKTTGIARIAQALKVRPEWLEQGHEPMTPPATVVGYMNAPTSRYSVREVDHAVSQHPPILWQEPKVWEDLLRENIKGQFRMPVKGDALLPNHPGGQMAIWEACDHTKANPGQAVLLWLPGDTFELRAFERRGASWAGVSQRLGYGELLPTRDGAEVVARLRFPDLG